MIEHVTYTFPSRFDGDVEFFNGLRALLTNVLGVQITDDRTIVISPSYPLESLPVTKLVMSHIDVYPSIDVGNDPRLSLAVGDLSINSRIVEPPLYVVPTQEDRLSMREVAEKLHNRVIRVDHTGFNLPKSLLSQQDWDDFISKVAKTSCLYAYPTGEPWLFILPSSVQENVSDIKSFAVGREPKIEITYDQLPTPAIQFDIEVDFTKPELEALFPSPYGFLIPGLEDSFRSLYVKNPWTNLRIRIDMRFKREASGLDWATGEWLVKEGGRIRNIDQ